MKTALISGLVITASVAIAPIADAAFLENFNSLSTGVLAGQSSGGNTWAIADSMASASARVVSSEGPDSSQSTRANSAEDRSAGIAINAATLAQIASGAGTFILEADMLSGYNPTNRYVGLGVGTSGLLNNGDNWLNSRMNDSGLYDRFISRTNGAFVGDSLHAQTYNRDDSIYQHHKLEVDLNASGIVTGARAYIDNNLAGTFSFGATPAWSPTHVGYVQQSSAGVDLADGNVDNFAYSFVAVPEPTSLALLGLGGLLVMRRRS